MPKRLKHIAQTAPGLSKVLFENDKVRVVELTVEKGSKADKHHHPLYFVYALTPFEYTSIAESGRRDRRKMEAGEIDWRDGESHSAEFLAPGRALVVELK